MGTNTELLHSTEVVDLQIGEWFDVITGVKQGFVLSPLIFLMVMYWFLKRNTRVISTDLK